MKGIQPTPLSTETICSFGCRSKMPLRMMLVTTRALLMKSSVPPMASFMYSSCDSHGVLPKNVIAVRLAPMWKWTGRWRSAHTSHSGSQALLARSGPPTSLGSDVMLTPRRSMSATRSASFTAAATSQAGRTGMGISRPPVSAWISAAASL